MREFKDNSDSEHTDILILQIKDMLRELIESDRELAKSVTEDYERLSKRIEKLEQLTQEEKPFLGGNS